MYDETEIKSELMPYNYDDSSLAWYVRVILEHYDLFETLSHDDLDFDIKSVFNAYELLSNLVESKRNMVKKPLTETMSFSRSRFLNYVFFDNSKNEELEIVMEDFSKYSELSELKFFYTRMFYSILKKRIDDDWCDIKSIEILENNDESKYINISDKILRLYYKITDFSTEKYPVYNKVAFKSLIRDFCELSAECVFNPGNANLNNILFRKSKTLETLYCIGKIPFQNSEKKSNKGYAYYNVCSPYVAEPFLRTVDNLNRLINKKSMDYLGLIPELKKMRTEIFINKMIKSFMRFTSYNKFTNYRVTLNRHNSELLSIPCNELSSIEEVKPIRLFEKIISHIYFQVWELMEKQNHKLNDQFDLLTVNVGVIGHAEVSYESANDNSKIEDTHRKEYREIYDLLRVIVDWYNRIADFKEIEVPKLDLRITYFVNEGDVLFARSLDIADEKTDSVEVISGKYATENGNIGRFYVKSCSYYNAFNFSKQKLLEILNQNDVVFILDCPWMTMENYELLSDGKLNSYCKFLKRMNYLGYKSYGSLDNEKNTDLQYLDAQYNRITSSDSEKSGFIFRIFRDDYIKAIINQLQKSNDELRKDVYIFSSDKEGVDYSYLETYPLLREEMYGDKIFSIAHFSNRKSGMLSLADSIEDLEFDIRLWSIFKYIAVSYVSVYFREEIDELFPDYTLSVEDYFELMRAIVVNVKFSDMNNIVVSLRFDDNVMDEIQKSIDIGEKSDGEIRNRLFLHVAPLIHSLYKDVIFSDDKAFGFETIRTAFEMNMYGSAKNVESMFFIHHYHKRRKKKCITNYNVKFDLESYDSFRMKEEFRHFKDKRLYQVLLKVLENTHKFGIKTTAVLSKAESLFEDSNLSVGRILLKNIAEVCRNTNEIDTDLYTNVLIALREY